MRGMSRTARQGVCAPVVIAHIGPRTAHAGDFQHPFPGRDTRVHTWHGGAWQAEGVMHVSYLGLEDHIAAGP